MDNETILKQQMAIDAAIRQTSRKSGFVPVVDYRMSPNEIFNAVRQQANAHNTVSLNPYRNAEKTEKTELPKPPNPIYDSLRSKIEHSYCSDCDDYNDFSGLLTDEEREQINNNLKSSENKRRIDRFNDKLLLLSIPFCLNLLFLPYLISLIILRKFNKSHGRNWGLLLPIILGLTTTVRDFTGIRIPIVEPVAHSLEMITYKKIAPIVGKMPVVVQLPIQVIALSTTVVTNAPNFIAWSLTNFSNKYDKTTAVYSFNNRNKTELGRSYWQFDKESNNWLDTLIK